MSDKCSGEMESLFGEQFRLPLCWLEAWLEGVLESTNAGSTSSDKVSGEMDVIVGFLLEFCGFTIGDCRTGLEARGFDGALPAACRAWF